MEPLEKPPSQQRKEDEHDSAEEGQREAQTDPESVVDRPGREADDDGQHEESQGVGNHRAADGDGHGLVFRDAQFADDRVGDQGVGGEHAGQQNRGQEVEVQQVDAGQNAQNHRDAEGEEAENQAPAAVFLEVRDVDFQPGEEHDIKESDRAGEYDAAVALHEVEPERPDDGAGDDQTQQVGNADFVEQQRGEEDDNQDEQEFQHRVGERQCEVYEHQGQHNAVRSLVRNRYFCLTKRMYKNEAITLILSEVRHLSPGGQVVSGAGGGGGVAGHSDGSALRRGVSTVGGDERVAGAEVFQYQRIAL